MGFFLPNGALCVVRTQLCCTNPRTSGLAFHNAGELIDYAMAQLDSFALYKKQVEGDDAWGSYLKLCGMGGTYGYFETLERAGLPNPLSEETVKSLMEFAENQAKELKGKLN